MDLLVFLSPKGPTTEVLLVGLTIFYCSPLLPKYISPISPLKLTSLNMRIESGDSIFYPRSLQWRPGALIICNFFCHGWNHTLLVFQIKRHLINLSWRRKSTNVRTGFYFFYFWGIMPLKGKLNIYFLARSLVWFF